MQDYTGNILFWLSLQPYVSYPQEVFLQQQVFLKNSIYFGVDGRKTYISWFQQDSLLCCFYLLLSKNNQVINDWMKPRNNPSCAKLYKISFKIKQFHRIEYDCMCENIYYTKNINEPDNCNCSRYLFFSFYDLFLSLRSLLLTRIK